MRFIHVFSPIVTFLVVIMGMNSVIAEVTVEPFGFAVSVAEDEEAEVELVLSNDGEEDMAFSIDYQLIIEEDERREGPRRDDPGDILAEYQTPHNMTFGMTWDPDHRWIWGLNISNPALLYAIDPADGEVVADFEAPASCCGLFYLDGVLWVGGLHNNTTIYRFTTDGEQLESWRLPEDPGHSIVGVTTDGELIFTSIENAWTVLVFNQEGEQIASIDTREALGGAGVRVIEWVSAHPDGQLWIGGSGRIYQCFVDGDWAAHAVQTWVVPAGEYIGITHDGENLWSSRISNNIWYVFDDGVRELHLLEFDPEEGIIEGEDSQGIVVTILPEGYEAGVYNLLIEIGLENPEEMRDDPDQNVIWISVVISIDSPTGGISGVVTDAATNEVVEGVTVEPDLYIITRFTDEDGAYAFTDLPPGNYELTFTAQDYLPMTREVELGEEDVELDVALLHSECNLSVEGIIADLAPDTDTEVDFVISNDGNGLLTYTSDRRLLGDANADPWGWRASFPVGETVDDNYLYGVVFINDHYYVSGENDGEPSIYVLDREGELVETIAQVGEDDDGVRDLAWDGELMWGTESDNIYGFTPEGELITTLGGPFRPLTAITWDPDRQVLWVAGTTRGISAIDLDGNEVAQADRHDLRIYGLAYWQDDPDGFPLYVFNKERDTNRQTVHKVNPDNDEFEFVAYLEPEAGGNPVGAFITNEYDIYSWVFVDISSASRNAGGDRIDIWQVDARKDWMQIEPEAGVIEADAEQPFVLTLDATGLPPAPFEGEIVFLHDGVGSETHLPVTLNVVEGRIPTERTLELGLGWNMVSVNLQPDERDVTVLTRPLVDEDLLEMMKDGFGHFYNPEFGFNNIPGWFAEQGYMMKVTDDCELTLEGMSVLAEDPIDLVEGWQIVSYYPRRPVEAILALSGIVDQLLIAKDGEGQFYIPEFGFSNMGDLREGQGYQLKMEEAARLVYTLQEEEAAGIPQSGRADIPACPGRVCRHFGTVTPTGENMSLLVLSGTPPFNSPPAQRWGSMDGAELGVFTSDGMLVGSGRFDDEGRYGVAIWGDDPTTPELDGARSGERLALILQDGDGRHILRYTTLEGDGIYTTDGLWIIELENMDSHPLNFGITSVIPNPFNDMTRILFELPEASKVSVNVYDITGRLIERLVEVEMSAGRHFTVWNASVTSAGVYLVQLKTGDFSTVRKMMLLR